MVGRLLPTPTMEVRILAKSTNFAVCLIHDTVENKTKKRPGMVILKIDCTMILT